MYMRKLMQSCHMCETGAAFSMSCLHMASKHSLGMICTMFLTFVVC